MHSLNFWTSWKWISTGRGCWRRRRVFGGGGIGVPPALDTMKQLDAKKIAVLAIDELFLNEEFENGEVHCKDYGSAGTKGNVMDAIRENDLKQT